MDLFTSRTLQTLIAREMQQHHPTVANGPDLRWEPTVQGEQQGLDGMLWSIRDIAPDPDLTAPVIEHVAMGDSHAWREQFQFVIYDPRYQPSGIDVTQV